MEKTELGHFRLVKAEITITVSLNEEKYSLGKVELLELVPQLEIPGRENIKNETDSVDICSFLELENQTPDRRGVRKLLESIF